MLKETFSCFFFSFVLLLCFSYSSVEANVGPLITKEKRKTITETEFGQISAIKIGDGIRGPYHLEFITLDPNSLFLPVQLHADMVLYVHTGSGMLNWIDEQGKKELELVKGDIYRLQSESVFYVQSSLESAREKLRIYAIFSNPYNPNPHELPTGPYSSLNELVLGFDKKVLQAAFQVPEEIIDEITNSTKPPPIVHMPSKNSTNNLDWKAGILEALIGGSSYELNKKKKNKAFNILNSKPDVENCNGWSLSVHRKNFNVLKGSNIGIFIVNLTQGSMVAPHWNQRASEIAIVTYGQGMVRVVCPSTANKSECKNLRFRVKEGDSFAVPRFHPMAQMSFNNDSFVFMGFSTMAKRNYPQFLAGKNSVFQTLDKDILAISFNVPNATIEKLFSSQEDSTIVGCVSCAEEEEKRMEEEIEREKQDAKKREEARKKEEEEKKREEEEKKREEEAERREEEARKWEEDEKKRQEEKKRREEAERREEARRKEEEAKKREEEARKRKEEEKKRKEEEKRREEEEKRREEAERRGEEEKKRKEEEKRREEEEKRREEAERREEEEKKRKEEEKRREEEEEAEKREKKEEGARKRKEEKKQHEEAIRKEEEEAKRQEEERRKRERQEEEEEERRRKEQKGEGEEERREGGSGGGGGGGGEGRATSKKIFIF